MRKPFSLLLAGCLVWPLYAGEPLPPLSLKDLLLQARSRNPEVMAARQAWLVKRRDIGASGSWPDPTLTYVDEKFPSGMAGMGPEKIKHYRIEQGIPFPGKLSAESKMKYHESLIAGANYRGKILDVDRHVRLRFYQIYLTDQKIDLATQSLEVLHNAVKTAQSRLSSGRSSAGDVFMAQTELRKMENELYAQKQGRILASIELNNLLDQPTDTALGTAAAPPLEDLPGTLADFQQAAKRNAPMYLAAEHEINHSRVAVKRTRLGWAPDLGVMYEHETAPQGDPGRQIGVSITFPLWAKRAWNQSASAKEHFAEALATGRQMQNEVAKMVHMEFVETQTHLAMARRYENGVLPSALSNLRVARQQYGSGQGDFLRLLEALRTWLDAHNQYQEELFQYGEHRTELSRWIGVDVENLKEALAQQEWMPEDNHE